MEGKIMNNDLNTLTKRVENILSRDNNAKNSDKWLIYRVLEEISQENGEKLFIPFTLFDEFPSFESITRCRRKLNEEGKHLPTDREVIEKRKKREKVFRTWAGA
jgi:hypothetical protein